MDGGPVNVEAAPKIKRTTKAPPRRAKPGRYSPWWGVGERLPYDRQLVRVRGPNMDQERFGVYYGGRWYVHETMSEYVTEWRQMRGRFDPCGYEAYMSLDGRIYDASKAAS